VTAVQDPDVQAPDPADPASGPHFDLDAYLATFDERMLRIPECRRQLTKFDPLLFALLYLPHHLRGDETGGEITFSEFHLDAVVQALRWATKSTKPAQNRDCYVGPRGVGKSTWYFLVIPLWAAAHGHRKFVAAFANRDTQAQMHLQTFKRELDTNPLLIEDYPKLCTPARRPRGSTESDNRGMLITKSGFVFGAAGIDSSSLGMKVGARRPDAIVLDDIEPDESNYSPHLKEKRLSTLLDAILPLNIYALVVLVGTVTMPSSIVHDLVKTITKPGEEHPDWIAIENWRVHYYPAIVRDDETGVERSIWPQKWSLEWLQSIRHTRSYKKNYANDPMGRDGQYWNESDFVHMEVPALTHQLLSIDPAVTSKEKSDFTAIAVVAYSAMQRRVVVRYAHARRVQPGEPLRKWVLEVLEEFPATRGIVVEDNQGKDLWRNAVLTGLPVPVKTVHQHEPKEVRAARALNWYQRTKADGLPYVVHERIFTEAEEQMVGFPKAAHDDLVDAIGTGIDKFLKRSKRTRSSASTVDPLAARDDDEDDEYLAS
jgi:phage terminase large subunit-like protein